MGWRTLALKHIVTDSWPLEIPAKKHIEFLRNVTINPSINDSDVDVTCLPTKII